MTDRGMPSADASPACPFVAFEHDRDARADRPDHRHRCFAEEPPAPRAAAHQEAYCLSSAFPVCPVFQTWARREAAQARPGEVAPAAPSAPGVSFADAGQDPVPEDDDPVTETTPRRADVPIEPAARRNPPRDWAAPPPWATGAAAGAAAGAGAADPAPPAAGSGFGATRPPEGQGLAGSAADRLARGDWSPESPSAAPDPELGGLVGGGSAAAAPLTPDQQIEAQRLAERDAAMSQYARSVTGAAPSRTGKRPSVSSTRSGTSARSQAGPAPREHVQDGPSWERARRAEAYPQIRGGGGMPAIPRIAALAGALALAAVALFFLPALFGVGSDDTPTPSPSSSSPAVTPTPEPTPIPDPTPQVYVIQEGDTLSGIAADFGLTLDELLAANETTIEDPNRISVGDEIIIPVPPPDEVDGEASPSEEATPEP